jgi:uncharacterized damage-inducible protein DinB
MPQFKETTSDIINQLIDLAKNLSDEEFVRDLPVLLNNSIGKHYRHIIEFYRLLFHGLDTGLINYDSREHDPVLEQDRLKCIEILTGILTELHSGVPEKTLELRACYSIESDDYTSLPTTLDRELVYNIEHAIHHMAIIRIALQNDIEHIDVPQQFGFAYSTLKHMNR